MRPNKIILILALLVLFLIVLLNYQFKIVNKIVMSTKQIMYYVSHPSETDGDLISTPGCVLPRIKIIPYKTNMSKTYAPYCDSEKRILNIDDDNEILTLTNEGRKENTSCLVVEVKQSPDDSFALGQEFVITGNQTLKISDQELLATKCGNYTNFDAHFPLTSKVKEKIHYWKSKPSPINILFIGIDAASRSHFYRSLVKTMPLVNSMGFVDFQGYHAVAPHTLETFFGLLMGKTSAEIRDSCAVNWTASFDTCPFIWEHFDLNKFITMFIEDGVGSFNWGGRGGFAKQPTDYYPHPLFRSIPEYRKRFGDTKHGACLSTLNAPNYMLEYTKRFVRKFKSSPFFAFTWLAYPFHDDQKALFGFDASVFNFFNFLNSDEMRELRERTLIIFNSDHGDRTGAYAVYDGFVERLLPALFIRLPENLVKMFPQMNLMETLRLNSKRLTSAFDIHHTFLHLLQMQDLKVEEKLRSGLESFKQLSNFFNKGRTSLFLPVSDQRNCDDAGIYLGFCVCNAKITSNSNETVYSSEKTFLVNKLIDFAIKELNSIVKKSKYRKLCALHQRPIRSLISARNINAETDRFNGSSEFFVLQFMTTFSEAWENDRVPYEVRIKTHFNKAQRNSSVNSFERVGPFNRLSMYGNSSWCVDFVTEEDKKMKEFCRCIKTKT